jgi:hypothetical protein
MLGARLHVPGTAHESTLSAQAICAVPGTLCPEPDLHPSARALSALCGGAEAVRICDYIGAGRHCCATYDGSFYKGKRIAVIGSGNSTRATVEQAM